MCLSYALLRPRMGLRRSSGVTVPLPPRTSPESTLFLGRKHYHRVPCSLPTPRCVQCRITYHASYSNMNLAQRIILGSATNDSHEFEVLNHSFCSSHSGVQFSVCQKKKDLHKQNESSPEIDHRSSRHA